MVKPSDLVNRAEGIRGQAEAEAQIQQIKGPKTLSEAEEELAGLKARMAQARTLPIPPGIDDGATWKRGGNAVLDFLERPEP